MVSIYKAAPTSLPNIVLFGEAGCGKSSIVNMLANDELAISSSGAESCTFESTGYNIKVKDVEMRLWDTTGLDEEYSGKVNVNGKYVDTATVAAQLYRLLLRLSTRGGVNLVFVVHGGRFKKSTNKNWKLFYECICRKGVPCVIVFTHLEKEDNMKQWWSNNKKVFDKNGIFPSDVSCITATRGKRELDGSHKFDKEYEESREEVVELISSKHSESPLNIPPMEWFNGIWDIIFRMLGWKLDSKDSLTEKLKGYGFSEEEIGSLKKSLMPRALFWPFTR